MASRDFMPDPNKDSENLKGDLETKETEETEETKEEKEPEKIEAEADEEPPVRRSAKDHIIERKEKKIKKLEEEKDKKEEDDEFSPEGRELIQSRIDRAVKPVLDQVRGQSDRQELSEVLKKYGEPAEKLEKKIEKYMNHPAYQNVPVEFIFLGLAQQGIKKAEKKEAADDEAARSATGGTQKRQKKIAKIPDVTNMSDKDFGQLLHKVRTRQF